MQVKLIVTNDVVDDERRFNVYRLYDNEILLGECYTSRKNNYILCGGKSISVEDRAPWYKDYHLCFIDVETGDILGDYHYSRPAFTIAGEYWEHRPLEQVERSIWKPSTWLKFSPHAWMHEDKMFSIVFEEALRREKPWGQYVAHVGIFNSNGPHILPMLVACYIMAEKEYRPD